MDIVFNINKLGLEGLGATLTSLIRNCSNTEELILWFLCSGLEDADKENVRYLLEKEKFEGKTEFVDFIAKQVFGHLRSLHGDWTSYGRLLIPNIIKSDRALYLDADLVILLDVLKVREFEFNGALLGAVYGSDVKYTLDRQFFVDRLNWAPEVKYFNAGVVLFNLKKWREEGVELRWKNLTERFPDELISHDQTILNALCEGNFGQLSKEFNVAWLASNKKPEVVENAIIHFVGSPKPWDLFGKYAHNGYEYWNTYNTPFWNSTYGAMTLDKWKRTWSIRRSLLKNIKNRILSK